MIDLRSEYSAMQIIERGDIDDEEAIGINESQEAGMYTCNGLMMQTKKHLTEIKGLSEAKADKICQVAEKLVLPINMRGGNGKVAYSDTEGTFRPDHIVPIAERFGMDAGAVLDNVIYARAYTYEHQYNLLLGLASKMAEEPFRLMIVDSIIALLRVDFTGRGELAERQQKLTQMPSRLTKIAEESNVVVYMTNQVIADPGGDMFMSDPKKHAGGHVLAHAATIRLMFRKGEVTEGINADDLRKLQEAGIYTCNRFMMQTKKLTGIKGLSEAKADNICEAAEKLLNFGYVTGSDVLLKIQSVIQVTTGGQALDELPGGGTEISCIIEAFEKFRSGKTQFAHTAMMLSLSKSNQHKMSDMVKPDYTTLVDALTQRKKATVHYLLLKPSNDSVAVVYGTLEGVPLIYGRIDIADWVGYRIVSSDNNHWCLMINDELHLRFVNVQTRAVVEVELLPFQPNAPPKFVGGCFYGDPEFSPIIAVFLNGSVGLTGRRANSIMYYDGKVWLEMNLDEDFLMTAPFMMNQALYWISNRCVLQKVDMSFLQSSLFVQELLGTDFPTWILHEGLLYVVALNGNGKAIVVKVNQTFDGYEIVPLSFSVYAICDGVGYAEEEQPSSIFLPAYHGCHIAVVDSIGVVSEYFTHPGCTCLPAWIGSILSFE